MRGPSQTPGTACTWDVCCATPWWRETPGSTVYRPAARSNMPTVTRNKPARCRVKLYAWWATQNSNKLNWVLHYDHLRFSLYHHYLGYGPTHMVLDYCQLIAMFTGLSLDHDHEHDVLDCHGYRLSQMIKQYIVIITVVGHVNHCHHCSCLWFIMLSMINFNSDPTWPW